MNFYTKHTSINAACIAAQRLISQYKPSAKPMAVFTTRHEQAQANRSALTIGDRHALR